MKHISILVPAGAILGSLEGTRQMFSQVNEFFKAKEQPPVFSVQLVGLSKTTLLSGGRFNVNADKVLGEVNETDLIIIPAVDGDIKKALEANQAFIPWITAHYKKG